MGKKIARRRVDLTGNVKRVKYLMEQARTVYAHVDASKINPRKLMELLGCVSGTDSTITVSELRGLLQGRQDAQEDGAGLRRKPKGAFNAPWHGTVGEAIDEATGELTSLRDEIQDWQDGMPESLQGGSKYDELQECLDALAEVDDEIEVPEALREVKMTTTQDTRKSAGSRAGRHSNALLLLQAAKEAVEAFKTTVDEAESTIGDYISEVENAEFPGQF